jgi:hypothetical protein
MNVTIIRCDGTEETHVLDRRTVWDDLERLIGARYTDVVNLRDGRVMVVDDEGYETKAVQKTPGWVSLEPVRPLKPDNAKATALYHAVCFPGVTHRIVGDVAVIHDEELR